MEGFFVLFYRPVGMVLEGGLTAGKTGLRIALTDCL